MFSKKLKHLIIALAIALTGSLMVAPAITSAANFKSDACQGLLQAGGSCSASSASSITNLLRTVIEIMSIVVGVASVIMIIIGGLRFITSGGDSANVASARNTVLYAVIGLVIAVLAQVIVHFVLKKVS